MVMDKMRQVFKVSVQGIELGMFVSRLDRPWLETSFPLEGFEIKTEEELQKLQRICSHVYVDIASGRSPDPRFVELEETALVEGARGHDELAELRKTDWSIQNDFNSELVHADAAHDTLERGIEEVMQDLRGGRELDLQKLHDGVEAMIGSITRNPSAFVWLKEIKRKDNYTYQHALGCSIWAATFGRHLGLEIEELRELALGGLLFDVGKTRLPAEMLAKKASLDARETQQMRGHVEQSLEILENTPGVSRKIIDMVATHHERYNGTGYPRGLSGSDIPIEGRILGLIDSYDALTNNRLYADALSPHQAVTELYKCRGTLFQSELVEQFILTCGIYPTGSLVELSNGQVGVVTAVHSLKRLRPSVMLLLDEDKLPLPQFRTIDLGEMKEDAHGRPLSIKCGLPLGAYGIDPVELFLD
jgi:HD-GYP domain-containing protein (c-di-GMP phosphodiesterase class II)